MTAPEIRTDGWGQYSRVMDEVRAETGGSAPTLRRAGVWVVVAFWCIQFAELSVVGIIQGPAFAIHQLPERLVIVAGGMVLSLLLVEFAARLEGRRFRLRLVATIAAALVLCTVLVSFAYLVAKLPVWGVRHIDPVGFVYVGFAWSWFFLSVAAAILALSYSAEMQARGERLARLQVVARDARIAALRYQINPHFLFNALNSIAGLAGSGDNEVAEAMAVNLADFLRATLELDPVDNIPLERELEFQRLYLAVEQARFPHRLVSEFEMPAPLASLSVPALIIQPIVENSIQHAVARSSGRVTVKVTASAVGGSLRIRVEDDGGVPAGPPSSGTGMGLRNVRDRLATQYGTEQSLTAEPVGKGFRTEIRIPLGSTS
ncbi:MAG: signal transduction histidine kinase LytS [Alphaproteobacteria bacterium]|nr:signal transduction histidine kinase LytS [Alphaproteobacteria bacterium]